MGHVITHVHHSPFPPFRVVIWIWILFSRVHLRCFTHVLSPPHHQTLNPATTSISLFEYEFGCRSTVLTCKRLSHNQQTFDPPQKDRHRSSCVSRFGSLFAPPRACTGRRVTQAVCLGFRPEAALLSSCQSCFFKLSAGPQTLQVASCADSLTGCTAWAGTSFNCHSVFSVFWRP